MFLEIFHPQKTFCWDIHPSPKSRKQGEYIYIYILVYESKLHFSSRNASNSLHSILIVQERLDACGLVSGSGGVWTTHLPRTRLYGVPRSCKGFQTFANATQMEVKNGMGQIFVPRLKTPCQEPNMMLCKPVVNWSTKVSPGKTRGGLFQHVGCRETGRMYSSCCEKKTVATPTCCNSVKPWDLLPSPPPPTEDAIVITSDDMNFFSGLHCILGQIQRDTAYPPWISQGVPGLVGWFYKPSP